MSIHETDAHQLIRDAHLGSEGSMGELLDSYRQYPLRIANQRIKSDLRCKMAASDVVQGAMLVAIRDFATFRGKSEPEFRAWLVCILTHQLADGLRRFVNAEKRRADREVDHGDSVLRKAIDHRATPLQSASLHEEAEAVIDIIQSLPSEMRDVVQARYLDGLTFPEISEQMKIPVTTCRRWWLMAVETIGQKLSMATGQSVESSE